MDIFKIIEEYLGQEKKGALATIVDKSGSAPREKGAKMFVGEDGRLFGTIGGGAVEADASRVALDTMRTGKATLFPYRMDASTVESEGMLCGGNVDLLIEPVLARHRELYRQADACGKKGRKAVIATSMMEGDHRKVLVDAYGGVWGDEIGEERRSVFQDLAGRRSATVIDGWIVEPVVSASNLIIFGAGHVSQFVSKVAKMVRFDVTVVDDREDFANSERFPEADRIVVEDFERVFDKLEFSGDVYVVIVTRGHNYDARVLEESLRRPTRYIGMIGSKKKVAAIMGHLRRKGVDEETLGRVYSPIGIKINSETPEEIAVSIAAELIKVRGE